MFGRDFEDEVWSRFVFELVIWPNSLLWKDELDPRVRCAFGNVYKDVFDSDHQNMLLITMVVVSCSSCRYQTTLMLPGQYKSRQDTEEEEDEEENRWTWTFFILSSLRLLMCPFSNLQANLHLFLSSFHICSVRFCWKGHTDFAFTEDGIILIHNPRNR